MISWLSGSKKEQQRGGSSLPSKKIDQILNLLCQHLGQQLSAELGESVEFPASIQSNLRTQIVQAFEEELQESGRNLESSLVQIKQRYNLLVTSLQQTRQSIRGFHETIGSSIQGLIATIGDTLKTKQLTVPLKEIKKGLVDRNQEAITKYMGLVGKLFVHQFGKLKDESADRAEDTFKSKSLQSELVLVKEQKKLLQKKILAMDQQKQSLNKAFNAKQQAILGKMKLNDQTLVNVMAELKQYKRKNQQLRTGAQILVESEESSRMSKETKEHRYLQNIKKLNQDRMEIEDRCAELQIQLSRLKNQQQEAITRGIEGIQTELKQSKNKIGLQNHQIHKLTGQIQGMEKDRNALVEKNVVRGMLEVYMDVNKEWAIKSQVQQQLCKLLDIKKQEVEEAGKKWFGIF